MERDEALTRMQQIQQIMERTTLYTLLPGAPAIIGGALALAGCAVSWATLGSFDFRGMAEAPQARLWLCVMWAGIGIIAVVQHVVLTALAGRRQGLAVMARPGQLVSLALTPSVFVALVLTAKLLASGDLEYLAPVWMMCYGTGVYAAGLFSLRLPRLLGLAFVLMGAVGLWVCPQHGVLLTALSFGLLHVAFGLVVIHRTRQGEHDA